MTIEIESWSQSYDSGGSGILQLQDIYTDETSWDSVDDRYGIFIPFNFSNAGCGDVEWEIVLGGGAINHPSGDPYRATQTWDYNNFDFKVDYPGEYITGGRIVVTVNVLGASDCDDRAVFQSDQYEIFVTDTETGTGGGDDGGSVDFGLGDLDWDCSISRTTIDRGETVEVDVDIDGFAPIGTGPWAIPMDILLDNVVVAEGQGSASPNGASGASFDLQFPEVGSYDVDVELYPPYEM